MPLTTNPAKRELASSQPASPLLDALQRDGFIRVPSLLNHLQLSALRTAAETATELARNGEWPYIRTVPKQFPPWPAEPPDDGIWGVQHLYTPQCQAAMPGRNSFAKLYFSNVILDIVKEQVGQKDSDNSDDTLVTELFNLLVSPTGKRNFELCWHRDDVRPDLDPDEE